VEGQAFIGGAHAAVLRSQSPLTDGKALMVYVKMPSTVDNKFYMNLTVSKDGQRKWPRPAVGTPMYLLQKGQTKWKKVLTSGEGVVTVGKGFEGYVRIPFESINLESDAPFTLTQEHTLEEFIFRADAFGGEVGAWYIGPLLVCTNDVMSGTGIVLGEEAKIRNLFTGNEMTKDELDSSNPNVPQIGDIIPELPEPTTDLLLNSPEETAIKEKSVNLTWAAMEGAASYRVDIFQSDLAASGMQYIYKFTKTVATNSATMDGLTPGLRYYVVVTALDASGKEMGIYNSVMFTTLGDGEEPVEDNDDDTEQPGVPQNPDTGYDGLALMLLIMASGFSGLVLYRSARKA
jgi:hypothetical protein